MASTSSAINEEYDVFLSFRGADTRKNFTSHLYKTLRQKGVKVFIDRRLERGVEISSSLLQIIESSKISIVIFSQNYVSSEFCLKELMKILDCRASREQVVLPVFYGLDPSEVKIQTGGYEEALFSHEAEFQEPKRLKTSANGEETIEDKMDKVRKWKSVLAKVADVAGWDLHNREEAGVIQDIVKFVLQKLNHLKMVQVEVFPVDSMVGKDFEVNMRKIWEWLSSHYVSSIGIWGMGGVGKTTLITHIRNKLLGNKEVFGQAYWVTVSQHFSVHNLQNLIAAEIRLDFERQEDLRKRAARLWNALKSKGKFVLILDDLWNRFDMKKVGIPIEHNGCKLIITTRSQAVCTQIGLQKLKKIEPLAEEDAWYLFKQKIGHDLAKNVEPIAKNVAKECGRLPLAIITMAGSMRGKDDIHEWNNALTELRKSEFRPDDMGDEVFRILRFSYTQLKVEALQQCLLYCALFPEDHKIERAKLIDFLIAEGIIKRGTSRQMDFDAGHTMLNKLVSVSLLEDVEEQFYYGCIKMHDLIRDMAIQIMKESCPSIVQVGKQLRQVPEEKDWKEGIVWVSLMKNDITEIPSNYSPSCSTLSTLLCSGGMEIKSIPNSFFLHFRGLKVLDLTKTMIEMLPESVGCLGNLKALSLRWCWHLRKLPSLGKLTSLEMLDLSYCSLLEEVPEGLELLSNLGFLDLVGTKICKLRSGMLTGLSHLQFLAFFCKCSQHSDASLEVKAAELVKLQKLEFLGWRFYDFREFTEYVQLVSRMEQGWQMFNYYLSVGKGVSLGVIADMPSGRLLVLAECEIDTELFIQKDLETLQLLDITICNRSGLCLKTDSSEPEIMSLEIHKCKMEYLFHLSSSPSVLENLKTLTLMNLPWLRALFGEEVEETPIAIPLVPCATTFSSLIAIIISKCNNMKSLCSPRLFSHFHNLQQIKITECSEMEVIVGETEDEISCGLTENYNFKLSKLRFFKLVKLPKLKRIGCEQIVCDSLRELIVLDCNELGKIPISLPLLSLQQLKLWPEEWWKSVEWGSPDQKSTLRPEFYRPERKITYIGDLSEIMERRKALLNGELWWPSGRGDGEMRWY